MDRLGHRLRVVEGQARVLGEGGQDVPLAFAVAPVRLAGSDHQRPGDLPALENGCGHRRREPVAGQLGDRLGRRRVALEHDQLLVVNRAPGDPPVDRDPPDRRQNGIVDPDARNEIGFRGVVSRDQAQGGNLRADQLGGPGDDRIEDVVEVDATGDRALHVRKPLHQGLTVTYRLEQAHGVERHRQHPSHPAEQVLLLFGQVFFTEPRDDQPAAPIGGFDRRRCRSARTQAAQLELAAGRPGDFDERRLGNAPLLEPDRRLDAVFDDHRRDLGLERRRCGLGGVENRRLSVGIGGN